MRQGESEWLQEKRGRDDGRVGGVKRRFLK